jgi:hypothetical protein
LLLERSKDMTRNTAWLAAILVAPLACLLVPASAWAQYEASHYRDYHSWDYRDYYPQWGLAVEAPGINTPDYTEGCPIETPDGLSLMIASTRLGNPQVGLGLGGLDIWSADRATTDAPWNEPRNLGAPVNSSAADFCPSPAYGRYLLFVSDRGGDGACGAGDIYVSRQSPAPSAGWSDPVRLRCAPEGPNTVAGEFSPSVVETPHGTFLFYSSTVTGDSDIYMSRLGKDGQFGPGRPVERLNTEYDDFMPNVRADRRGGYEIVFNSNRPTWGRYGQYQAFGGQDIYTSRIRSLYDSWARPRNLGPNVNTSGGETRATLSGDGKRLNFGRDGDIYTSMR